MTSPSRTPEQLQEDMEAARINMERWRAIHRRAGHTLREEYPEKYAGLARDEARDEEMGQE